MDLKSVSLWTLAAIGGLAGLIGNIEKIRDAVPVLKRYPVQIIGAILFLTGAGGGVLWEKRIVDEKQTYLTQVQNQSWNLQQKYESLLEATSCKRNTPQVLLFEDANYRGRKLCFMIGSYPDLGDFAFSDITSSISLAGNVKVVVYEDINYGGRSLTVDKNYDSLSQDWNDKISSLKVCKRQDLCN